MATDTARAALVDALVADAHRLLGALPEVERDAKQAEALALLALIALASGLEIGIILLTVDEELLACSGHDH